MGAPVLLAEALPHLLVAEAVVGARPHGGRARLRMDTVELDTHLFFRESYETRDQLVDRYQLKLIQPEIPTIAEQHRAEGANLWERDPDRCCHIRKVEPLVNALAPYDAWISGIRRDQSPSRADTPKVQWSSATGRQDPPARRLGREAGLGLHRRQRDPLQPCTTPGTVRSAVSLAHGPRVPKMRSGLGAGRDRTSSNAYTKERHWKGQHESAHPRTEHPESETDGVGVSRSGSPGSRVRGRRRSRITSVPRWTDEDSSSSTSTETRCARISRRGSGSRRRTATRTWNASAGSPHGSRATEERSSWPRSRPTSRRAVMRARCRGARSVHRDPRENVARRVRPSRCERALREGVRRRDHGLHGRGRPVRGACLRRDRGGHRGAHTGAVRGVRHREARGARLDSHEVAA